MTPESVGPFSRPFRVDRLPPEGAEVTVEATPEECAALAVDFKLPGIQSVEGRYRVTGSAGRVRVVGRVRASITQVYVVTLELFDSVLDEEVAVDFAGPEVARSAAASAADADPPDEITDGTIDLGSLSAEFVALGLDPYPKKPGVAFSFDEGAPKEADSPFATLGRLKSRT